MGNEARVWEMRAAAAAVLAWLAQRRRLVRNIVTECVRQAGTGKTMPQMIANKEGRAD